TREQAHLLTGHACEERPSATSVSVMRKFENLRSSQERILQVRRKVYSDKWENGETTTGKQQQQQQQQRRELKFMTSAIDDGNANE
ncbi:unnamed protein product, partial [Ceratitis capitata]